jgi:hypothetical protein
MAKLAYHTPVLLIKQEKEVIIKIVDNKHVHYVQNTHRVGMLHPGLHHSSHINNVYMFQKTQI